ncbi:hypothetical protein Tco_1005983 [Tanacetum coccineum]|uniref:Uncharacterized protein n=1 Tax=Tanacetum coccineum TaxID=301880 RepID=A0ABQ5FGJ8_9ASTR
MVKKKETIYAADHIIPDLEFALELGDDEEVDWIESDEDEEKKDDTDDDKSIDLEMTDDEETDDDFVHGDEQINDDKDEEMLNAEVEDSGKGFGDQFLKLSSDTSLVSTVKGIIRCLRLNWLYWLRVAKLEKDVSELKKIDHSAKALATLKSQVPTVVEHYHESKIDDDLQKVLQRHIADLIQKYFVKPAPEYGKIQKPTIDLE